MPKSLARKPKKKAVPALFKHRNKIEKFRLEEVVLRGVVTEGRSYAEVARLCNVELVRRGQDHLEVSSTNVKHYVKRMSEKLAMMEQEFFQDAIQGAGIVDEVAHLSSLVNSGYERRQAIRDDMMACFEKDDRDGFQRAVMLDQKNDQIIADTVNKLSQIKNKLQTCVTIEYVYTLVQKMVDIVLMHEGIEGAEKEHLVVKMSQVIDFKE